MNEPIICSDCGFNWSEAIGDIAASFAACGKCGTFMPHTKKVIEEYLELMRVNNRLSDAVRLALKGETTAAVREATVSLETVVRKKSGLTAIGAGLMDQAFSFEYDRKNNVIRRPPLIQLNNLSNETKRNEQDGIRHYNGRHARHQEYFCTF